jgi:hypothetical protein
MGEVIPDAALETHIGVLGKTGAGKSYTARGLVERLLTMRRHVVVVDPTGAWWGLRTGYQVPIFGGRHGDIDISDTAGEAVAAVIDEQRTSAIVDLSLMSGGAQKRFMRGFAHRLRAKQPGALYLVIDEADEFLPQNVANDQTNAFGDLKWMVRRGRLNGFRVMMVTQRPAEIAKAVLTQIETLIAHRLTAPQDRKAIEEWVKGHHDPAEARNVLSTLASLEKGVAWVWSPDLNILVREKMPLIETFDSGRTPEPGETSIDPPSLDALDLSAIRVSLETVTDAPKSKAVGLPTYPDLRGEVERLRNRLAAAEAVVAAVRDALAGQGPPIVRARPSMGKSAALVQATTRVTKPAPPERDGALKGPQRQMLGAIAWWAAMGHAMPSKAQVAAIAGWRITSGHLKNVAGSLRTLALIDYPSPGMFALTDEGRAAAPEPDMSASFHDSLRGTLTGPQRAVFDYLLSLDRALSREDLARAMGWEPTSGHVKNVLGSMRTLEIIEYPAPGLVCLQGWITGSTAFRKAGE